MNVRGDERGKTTKGVSHDSNALQLGLQNDTQCAKGAVLPTFLEFEIEAKKQVMRNQKRVEFGDWQTPLGLAREITQMLACQLPEPATVVEPTCGRGSFLVAASESFPRACLAGFEINPEYVSEARSSLADREHQITVADFFELNWEEILLQLPAPIALIGNPPWVTNAALGSMGAGNLPAKTNFKNLTGLDAVTGKSNFDISEWMLMRLLQASRGLDSTLAMLCKSSVARKVLEYSASQGSEFSASLYAIDARAHFAAAVDAVLLTVRTSPTVSSQPGARTYWSVFDSLASSTPSTHISVVDGILCSDVDAYAATSNLKGSSHLEWRSGIKHDCSRVMELADGDGFLLNGIGERLALERDYVYPLLKGSDLANGRAQPRRRVIVTQRVLGENTESIQCRAPLTWQYLMAHRADLQARRSKIYRDQPAFAVFGVGDYAFAPYKVAICGLYKRLTFALVRPVDGQPVMVDDTAYFLPCTSEEEAEQLARALNGPKAAAFFRARIFWDAKRPINKALLQSLSLDALLEADGVIPTWRPPRPEQQTLVR